MAEVKPLDFTGRFAGGLIADLKRRAPFYKSDWTDALKEKQKTLSSTLFLFFACLAPAIAFGAIFDKETGGQLGALEMILSSAISGVAYSIFSGQPLCIMGATGPELAYTVVFYQMCESLDIEFMPARVWEGLWCALFTIILALTDSSAIMVYVTQFTEDVFSALISLIFIFEAFRNVAAEFHETGDLLTEGAFFTVILAVGTVTMAMYLRDFRGTSWLNAFLRNTLANFGVLISIAVFTALSFGWYHVEIQRLRMPDSFEPSMILSNNSTRPWIINPMGIEKDFPHWAIWFSALPAVGLCILGFLDQGLTSLLINRKSSNLKKPPAYHLDLLVCGVFIYPICSVLGLPFTHAATIRSLTHLISLTDYETVSLESSDGQVTFVKKPVAVAEQRVTNFSIHILIGLSALMGPLLKELPQAVLYGVFLYMGVSTISGNALFDRLSLWLIWDTSKYPKYPFLEGISLTKVHLYTFVQFLCLVILYALKANKELAVVFPFFLIVIVIVRLCLPRWFSAEELRVLDGGEVEPKEFDKEEIDDQEKAVYPAEFDQTPWPSAVVIGANARDVQ